MTKNVCLELLYLISFHSFPSERGTSRIRVCTQLSTWISDTLNCAYICLLLQRAHVYFLNLRVSDLSELFVYSWFLSFQDCSRIVPLWRYLQLFYPCKKECLQYHGLFFNEQVAKNAPIVRVPFSVFLAILRLSEKQSEPSCCWFHFQLSTLMATWN